MSAQTQQLVTELLEAWNAHDIERTMALYTLDFEGIDVARAHPQRGPTQVGQHLMRYIEAFPDLHFTGETIIQRNRVALIWVARGTHQGTLLRIPATGRRIEVRGVSVLTIRDGKISRGLYIWDVAGLLRAIGLLPELT